MWQLSIENIAGIRSGSATIEPGVNAVEASNWRGKSSLIVAIETALGIAMPLTEGEERGRVTLETDEGTFVTELLRRDDGSVEREGDLFLSDEHDRVCAELFAALGEANAIRRAVREGENLEELLSRPLALENIDQRIADLRHEREEVERELERAETAAAELPTVQERVTQLEAELSDLREEREELAAGEGTDADLGERREALSEKRAAHDRVAGTIDRLSTQIDQLEDQLDSSRAECEALSVPDESTIETGLEATREQLSDVSAEIELLQTVYNANRRVLEEGRVDLLTEVERNLSADAIECWVCGETADRAALEGRLSEISEAISSRRERESEFREKVETLEAEQRELSEKRMAERDLEDEIRRLSTRLDDRRGDLETANERHAQLAEAVEELSSDVEVADERLTDVESEIKYKEAELADAREELTSIEQQAEAEDAIAARRDELSAEIEELRTRKERKKRDARDAFDEAIETVLETFEPGFESARLTAGFDLVVARGGREVGPDALSEGEVELLGFIVALAGYEAFEVGERVPVILLDSLGGLAGENLHRLVAYFEGRSEHLVTTAYPEQGGFEWHTISPEEWAVVSDSVMAP